MIDFSKITRVTIPEGVAIEIKDGNGNLIWDAFHMRYVSLGDSIAAGHSIDSDWSKNYGVGSQYGENGNTSTEIVTNSYTDLIKNKLGKSYGPLRVLTTSFAHSGDTVGDLIAKLGQNRVKPVLSKSDMVTICIGANNVLVPAMASLNDYIMSGDLTEVDNKINSSLGTLTSGNGSYLKLFELLNDKTNGNPNAKYVFTTIYNPYKYLHIDEGANGFFKPLLDTLKTIGLPDWLSTPIANGLLSTDIFKQVFARVNDLSRWTETWVTQLNNVLKEQVAIYNGNTTNKNIFVADTKALFDTFPDRGGGQITYDMLVNVEYTAGFKLSQADWGQLWGTQTPYDFFIDLANKNGGILSFDLNGFATDLIELCIERVFVPDLDPHPEKEGQYALYRSFSDTLSSLFSDLNFEKLKRYTISYATATGGTGFMPSKMLVTFDGLTAYTNIDSLGFSPDTSNGYYFTGWKDGSGNSYSANALIGVKPDEPDITLTAQWSNLYTLTFRHSYDSYTHTSSDTGPMECYALWINGQEQSDLGAFSNGGRVYNLPYGTPIGVVAQVKNGDARSYIDFLDANGNVTETTGLLDDARSTFKLLGNTDVHFVWNYWLNDKDWFKPQSYWICEITK